ncbi:MAG: hypothetical protein RMJ59_03195 [Candidatus Nitrosocaldus sp.]|nr:hypothetical protein [Candidatus Nitrosocaldus sp.]MCS7140939.1 hypothetical protein [Candidatus Nitrosocaldus sp.]MDW7999984.1 hypothetical protein [Candidatus Nitrosocaldus sp.]MDW8275374.1 hypothetical protein [Candidatus Nitrosocaldus sp.]
MQYRRRTMGVVLFISSIVAFMIYSWLLLASEWSVLILKYTVLMLVACIAGVFAWLGLSIAMAGRRRGMGGDDERPRVLG